MSIGGLKVGVNVDIQRSDGRIHSAVVSGVNEEAQSVTVEWYEKGETKGKEIEAEQIFGLNQDLLPSSSSSTSQAPAKKDPPPKKAAAASKASERQTNGTGSRIPSSQGGRPRPSYVRAPSQNSQVSSDTDGPAGDQAKGRGVGVGNKAGGGRKSHCVKEVERIQKQREQRRAKAFHVKEQIQSEDTSTPNWEFLRMIKEYQEQLEYRPITMSDPISDHQICVCIRKRPLSKKEIERRDIDVICVPNKENVVVHEPKVKVDLTKYLENQQFRFDYAFDENASNEIVYRYAAKPLVESIFDQGMATCFAYGQTGSGKTHTMGGDFESKGKQDASKGIYVLAASDVFKLINSKYKKADLVVGASFFEIYSGKVFDLLNKKQKLRVLEDHKSKVQVVGLKEEVVEGVDDVLRLIQLGTACRTSGTTSANQHSSRSHAVFQLILRKRTAAKKLHGKFSLVDLAGNERGADTSSSDRQTRLEGAEINKSLLALKECIRALGKEGPYVPFRASKLTQVLRDSFIGNKSRTCMIAAISPGNYCCEHSINTLRYADRVKELGPGGPVEGKPAEIAQPGDMGAMSPQNSDLAILRTANREDLSDDLMTFHQVVNHMQEQEDEMIDSHRAAVEESQKWNAEHRKLLRATEAVDYDTEAYAAHLNTLLDNQIAALQALKGKVSTYTADLAEEEKISKQIKQKKKPGKK